MIFNNNPVLLQIWFSTPVFLLELFAGILSGWLAPAILYLKSAESEIPVTIEEISWISSLSEVGRFVGALPAGTIGDKIGRKYSFIISTVIYMFAWSTITFANSVAALYVGRFTLGVAVGMADVLVDMYASEIPAGNLRGIIAATCLSAYFLGILLEFALGIILSYHMMNISSLAMSFLIFLSTIFLLIETPHHLVNHAKLDKALSNLEMIRVRGEAQIEFEDIKKDLETQRETAEQDISRLWKSPVNKYTMIVVIGLSMLTVFTGFQPITSYVSLLFPDQESYVLYGVASFVTSAITPFLIDRAGRRMLLLGSLSLSALVHILVAIYYIAEVDLPSYVLFVLLTSYAAIYSSCMFPASAILRGELFPQTIKGIGASVGIASCCISGFISTKLFHEISDAFGIHWNFIIFAILSVIGYLFIYFLLPETKGKSLPQIQQIFLAKCR